jgi:hypothetical protein
VHTVNGTPSAPTRLWCKTPFLLAVAALLLATDAAHARPLLRTWVSSAGNDTGPCSRTLPCQTFAGALSKTPAGGVINCVDSGNYGPVTITKAISIVCEGVIAGVHPTGANGITINVAAGDRVLLQGLDIEGVGAGVHGVSIIGAGSVIIRKTTIRRFAQFGVQLAGSNNARVVIDQSFMIGNGQGGLFVQGVGGSNFAFVNDSLFDSNGPASVTIAGSGNVTVSGSSLHGSSAAFAISGGGNVTSSGDNVIRGTGVPTSTVPRI